MICLCLYLPCFSKVLSLFQETVLGMASLSALGSFGAALEIVLILYPFFCQLLNEKSVDISHRNHALYDDKIPLVAV